MEVLQQQSRAEKHGYYDHQIGRYIPFDNQTKEVDHQPSFVVDEDSGRALQVHHDTAVAMMGSFGQMLGTFVNGVRQFKASFDAEIGGFIEEVTRDWEYAGAPARTHTWTRTEFGPDGTILRAVEEHTEKVEAQATSHGTETRTRTQEPSYIHAREDGAFAGYPPQPQSLYLNSSVDSSPRKTLVMEKKGMLFDILPVGRKRKTFMAVDALEIRDIRSKLEPQGFRDAKP